MIGGVGNGEQLQRAWFTEERLGIATHGLGAMWRLLEETTAWALLARPGRPADHRPPGHLVPARRLGDRRGASGGCWRCSVAGLIDARRRSQADPREGVDGEAVRQRGGRPLRRPRGAGVRRARLHAQQRRRALQPRAARRPHLGGHERDPAPDHRPRARAARRRARRSIEASSVDLDAAARPGARSPSSARPSATAATRAQYAAQPRRDRLRRARSGASTRATSAVHGRPCVPTLAELPEPVDAVVVAIPAAGRRGGRRAGRRARLRRRRRARRRLRRGRRRARAPGRARRRGAPAPRCRCAGPTATGSSRWRRARRCGATRCAPREAGHVALVSQSGNVAVNALDGAARAALPHGRLLGQPGGALAPATTSPHLAARRRRPRDRALPRGRRRRARRCAMRSPRAPSAARRSSC